MKKIAIITARGGSKRIPKKNIKAFHGKPIIAYSIEAALGSNIFDEVMVSTDDEQIKEIALKYGAKVPFTRSEKNSNDSSSTVDVILEVLESYKDLGSVFDYACCIYPTAPFLNPKKLRDCFEILKDNKVDSVVPITAFSFPILKSFKLDSDNKVSFTWPEYKSFHSQELPESYHDSGQFYFFDVVEFLKNKSLFTGNTLGYIIPETEVQDINTFEDWKLAEIKYAFINKSE